jgi:ketosteroid isomerase-like protein
MPPEPSELRAIAETALRALNAGDLDGFLGVVADDVEFTSMILEVEGQTFRGREGVRDWWHAVVNSFEDVKWELLELAESDGRAVAKLRAAATLGGGQVVDQLVWQAATYKDGLLTWWAFFRNEEEALEAVALR